MMPMNMEKEFLEEFIHSVGKITAVLITVMVAVLLIK